MEERGEKKERIRIMWGMGCMGVYEKQMETKHLLTSIGYKYTQDEKGQIRCVIKNKKNKKN